MRLSHARRAMSARFDDPNLVSCRRAGRGARAGRAVRAATLLAERLTLAGAGRGERGGEGPGAGGRDGRRGGLDRRHGPAAPRRDGPAVRPGSGRPRRWARSCAGSPSATSANSTRSPPACWPALARATPILPGADRVAFLDIDDTVRQTYGYAKQGAGRGYTGVKGLNALLAIVSTPLSAPVIAAARLRKGSTNSVRGAASLLTEALATAAGAGGASRRPVARAGGLGVLRPRHRRRLPPCRGPVLDHRPDDTHGDQRDRQRSTSRRGSRSATATPSSTR